jgi:hypothetical protein
MPFAVSVKSDPNGEPNHTTIIYFDKRIVALTFKEDEVVSQGSESLDDAFSGSFSYDDFFDALANLCDSSKTT